MKKSQPPEPSDLPSNPSDKSANLDPNASSGADNSARSMGYHWGQDILMCVSFALFTLGFAKLVDELAGNYLSEHSLHFWQNLVNASLAIAMVLSFVTIFILVLYEAWARNEVGNDKAK